MSQIVLSLAAVAVTVGMTGYAMLISGQIAVLAADGARSGWRKEIWQVGALLQSLGILLGTVGLVHRIEDLQYAAIALIVASLAIPGGRLQGLPAFIETPPLAFATGGLGAWLLLRLFA